MPDKRLIYKEVQLNKKATDKTTQKDLSRHFSRDDTRMTDMKKNAEYQVRKCKSW